MKIKEIIQATNGKLIQGNEETEIKEFCKDTRIIKPGDTYIGIKGENFDGNTLWQKAFEAGADIVIVQGIDFSKEDCIKIKECTEGNRVKTVQIGNLELSGVEVRTLLGLRSANFKVTIEKDNIIFEVTGYGHGVGMSQTGADSLAKQGENYEEIIHHFYTNVKIQDI